MKRRLIGWLMAAVAGLAIGAGGVAAQGVSLPPGQAAIEAAIHDYILKHPEVIIQSLQQYQDRRKQVDAARSRDRIQANRELLFNDATSPVAGNPEGDVTVVEFFDYKCPYCKRVLKTLQQAMKEDPGIRMVFKEFPILGPGSVIAARAALASRNQYPEKYAEFHDALMTSRQKLTESYVLDVATDLGFDRERLRADMYATEISAVLDRNRALAEDIGIRGTPGFVIGDKLVPGALDLQTLKRLIARARSG